MKEYNKFGPRIGLIGSMTIFGTIGLFVRWIPIPSGLLAMIRGLTGAAFLVAFMLLSGKKATKAEIRKNLFLLIFSGAAIGFNWVLLFESYKNTTVAVATLCYYMEPVIVILLSPFFFKEKLGIPKAVCCAISVFGMVLVSGIFDSKSTGGVISVKGIVFGLSAAILYSAAVIANKFMKDISAYTRTSIQLFTAAIVLIPYIFSVENVKGAFDGIGIRAIILIVVVGIVHTGIAYTLYFGSMDKLPAQTIALFSYIDPVVAILISAFVLKENMGISSIIGAFLVLGATLVSEIIENK